jgi:hypothetical protein
LAGLSSDVNVYAGVRSWAKKCVCSACAEGCYKGVTRVLQGCYKGVTRVLQGCYRSVTRVLQGYYKGVTRVCISHLLFLHSFFCGMGVGGGAFFLMVAAVVRRMENFFLSSKAY